MGGIQNGGRGGPSDGPKDTWVPIPAARECNLLGQKVLYRFDEAKDPEKRGWDGPGLAGST